MIGQKKPVGRMIGVVVLVLLAVAMGWAIGRSAGGGAGTSDDTPAPDPRIGFHDISGRIVRLSPQEGIITLDHEQIKGFMAAMVMDLRVAEPRELIGLEVGDDVLFDLVKLEGQYRVVRIRKTAHRPDGPSPSAAPAEPIRPDALSRGDLVPDLPLIDARGQRFHLHQVAARRKIITFFYARCPLEQFCPAQSRRLSQLQDLIDAGTGELHLISLTLDSEHDGPDILRGYASHYRADPARWTLACSDDPSAIRDFADRIGARIQTHPGNFQIDHALVAVRVDGNRIVDYAYGLEAIEQLIRNMTSQSDH